MSYTPTEWKTGDVITAEKLNNMEQGVAGSAKALFLELNPGTFALNKTWREINSALSAGALCLFTIPEEDAGTSLAVVSTTYQEENKYYVYLNFERKETATLVFGALAPDDYPTPIGQ